MIKFLYQHHDPPSSQDQKYYNRFLQVLKINLIHEAKSMNFYENLGID